MLVAGNADPLESVHDPGRGPQQVGLPLGMGQGVRGIRAMPGQHVGQPLPIKTKDGKTQSLTVDRAILAVGITGNIENLGLEQVGVKTDRGHIVINEWSETGVAGLYAIGDVAGPPWLAHKAMHEGVVCVERIAGIKGLHPLDVTKVPGCTYCWPQVASVGLTESKAKAAGREVKVGRFPYIGNGKAIALGETEGLIKTIFDAKTGELLGAHMIGAEVTELIQGYTIAKNLEVDRSRTDAHHLPAPDVV